ncbi:MAG: aspartate dehydrogenase domain-containing protein [Candidatus Omnitrophota bacterium]
MKLLQIGIVGCGAIGGYLARAIQRDFSARARLRAVCDVERKNAEALNRRLAKRAKVVCLDALIAVCDLVIEAASANASADIVVRCVAAKKDVLVMSVGGLLGREDIFARARRRGVSIYLPSGAVVGLDGLRAAAETKIKSVRLTTRKPLKSLPQRFGNIRKETVIFQGTAKAAIKKFPRNINVAVTLSLTGLGAQKTRVRIIADPRCRRNTHEIEIISDAARIWARAENLPLPDNTKTSRLAALSAVAVLRQIFDSVKIGT